MTNRPHESITATELVRSLSVMIDRVRMSGRSVFITKGSRIVAELRPPLKTGFPIERLGRFLKVLPNLGNDSQALYKDLDVIRKQAQLPGNPWD